MAKALKIWHQWGWLISIAGYLILFGVTVGHKDAAVAQNIQDLQELREQKLPERMATQEQSTKDIKEQLTRMEHGQDTIQGIQEKIFERINQIADRRGR